MSDLHERDEEEYRDEDYVEDGDEVENDDADDDAGEDEMDDDVDVADEDLDISHTTGGASGQNNEDDEDDEDDEYDEPNRFANSSVYETLQSKHPESQTHNTVEIEAMARVIRDRNGFIVDGLHTTLPLLTKYERTRILGMRTKQLNAGGRTTLDPPPPGIVDGYQLANLELIAKKLPFIIRRPIPGRGCEYWNLTDLELGDM
jgi:DNA-directed RNA polymerase subunit K/omega